MLSFFIEWNVKETFCKLNKEAAVFHSLFGQFSDRTLDTRAIVSSRRQLVALEFNKWQSSAQINKN